MTTPTSHRGIPSEDERQDLVVGIFPKHRRCIDGRDGGPCITCAVGLANGHAACTVAVSA